MKGWFEKADDNNPGKVGLARVVELDGPSRR